MEMKNDNGTRAGTGLSARDWWVLGIGALIVVALVAFVALRMNRNRQQQATSAPAPSTATAAPAAPNMDEASVRRIKPDDLQAAMSRGEVTVVDVRDADSYAAAHIPGAMHVPVSFMENEVPYLPPGKAIVTYCT